MEPQLSFYTDSYKPNAKFGFYFFTLVTENWGQGYGGIIFKPINWLAVSIGAGLETHEQLYRVNLTLFMKKNKFNFLQIYEYGGTGLWYNIYLSYELNKNNNAGIMFKRYYGIGINYEHIFKNTPFSLSLFPSWDYEVESYKITVLARYYIFN